MGERDGYLPILLEIHPKLTDGESGVNSDNVDDRTVDRMDGVEGKHIHILNKFSYYAKNPTKWFLKIAMKSL